MVYRPAKPEELSDIATKLSKQPLLIMDDEQEEDAFRRLAKVLTNGQVWVSKTKKGLDGVVYIESTSPDLGQLHCFFFNGVLRRKLLKLALENCGYREIVAIIPAYAKPVENWAVEHLNFKRHARRLGGVSWQGRQWNVQRLVWTPEDN